MPDVDFKKKIERAVNEFAEGSLTGNALSLFSTLGYNTDRQGPFQEKTYAFFKDQFLDSNSRFKEDKALVKDWKSVDLLFQLTQQELSDQLSAFETGPVQWEGEDKKTVIETYLFFAIELKKEDYTRTALAEITRELNKVFPMPVMLLFKHGGRLTVSVINRRLHKKDEHRDVLEKVTLIKDISLDNPHRAHVEILFDLSLEEIKRVHSVTNFVELHHAWQKTLDTKELNRRFYQELFNWYLWALAQVQFPQVRPQEDTIDDRAYQAESLIRLLTRLLFVWFMQEKGLVNPDLFNEKKLKQILKGFLDKDGEATIYYRAILQNLFFATLNKPIGQRKLIDKTYPNPDYGDPLVYRYDELFREPENILAYFGDIPFLNGGLFDCLDQKKDSDNPAEIRLDGFSTVRKKQPLVADKLFFGEYQNIDLSEYDDDSKKKNVTVHGLIDILAQYKFTIEENTPIEEDIALDPELLGRVFENLLASYNPETRTTARKQTGSFYTPREIVNYMVDESLIAYLSRYVHDEERLRKLTGYKADASENPFTPAETQTLLAALDNCRALDPACGSGAFPMGILQKILHILHKLDPENKSWFEMVINNFPAYMQGEMRRRLAKENWNYVRKLGIIQQCIYGVDIQPIATQIAKLRFFISLLVDQAEKPGEPNRGFDPLPNLDFKIVTANTLVAAPELNETGTGLFEGQVDPFFSEFNNLTSQYFTASNPADKNRLRTEISSLIKSTTTKKIKEIEHNFETALDARFNKDQEQKNKAHIAEKKREIALWKSYTNLFKHESVGFFEPRYFFPGVADGFDIVIGNPPYVQMQKDSGALANIAELKTYSTYERTGDIYMLFYELGFNILKTGGIHTFITSSQWMKAGYGKSLRKLFLQYNPLLLLELGPGVFENAVVDTNIMLAQKDSYKMNLKGVKINNLNELLTLSTDTLIHMPYIGEDPWTISNSINQHIQAKITSRGTPLKKWNVIINRGILTGYNEAFIIDQEKRDELVKNDPQSDEIIRPILRGRGIQKYSTEWDEGYLIFIPWHFPLHKDDSIQGASEIAEKKFKKFYPGIYKYLNHHKEGLENRNKAETGIRYEWYALQRCAATYHNEFEKEKIVWKRIGSQLRFSYSDEEIFCLDSTCILTGEKIKYLVALLNSKLCHYQLFEKAPKTGMGDLIISVQALEPLLVYYPQDTEEKIIETIVDYILHLKQKKHDSSFFERLIDFMVYELYFPDKITAAGAEVLKHVTNLPQLKDNWSDAKKQQTIEKVYAELSGQLHPVASAMQKQKTVAEVRIIEGIDT